MCAVIAGTAVPAFDFSHPVYRGAAEWAELYRVPASDYARWGEEVRARRRTLLPGEGGIEKAECLCQVPASEYARWGEEVGAGLQF